MEKVMTHVQAIAVAAAATCWLLAIISIVSWGPYPSGERHCDDTGCWQIVEE
jgi:hypothetical protein